MPLFSPRLLFFPHLLSSWCSSSLEGNHPLTPPTFNRYQSTQQAYHPSAWNLWSVISPSKLKAQPRNVFLRPPRQYPAPLQPALFTKQGALRERLVYLLAVLLPTCWQPGNCTSGLTARFPPRATVRDSSPVPNRPRGTPSPRRSRCFPCLDRCSLVHRASH